MKLFTRLFLDLDSTTRTAEKSGLLERYFREASPPDAAWALYFLTGRKVKRAVNTRLLREWAAQAAALPSWLIDESYDAVGDLAETLALVLPESASGSDLSLQSLVEQRIVPLASLPPQTVETLVRLTWRELDSRQRLVWHKLIMGEFRVGVARTLVARALATVAEVAPEVMAHRLMGPWKPTAEDFAALLSGNEHASTPGRPYPFFLAQPLIGPPTSLGECAEWQAEWKWDGIRAQLIKRQGQILVWSRGEELITDRFPEIEEVGFALPDGVVLDGEIMAWKDEQPLPFGVLQTRIGRKNLTPRIRAEAPAAFIAFDLLENDSKDIREQMLVDRRNKLAQLVGRLPPTLALRLSAEITAIDWDELAQLRAAARTRHVEGIMLKRRGSAYGVGRPKGDWWKWKVSPYAIDAVLIYAQRGHGRRASLYTDYTFGVWNAGELVPVAKAYSGLTDEEIGEVDRYVRDNTIERFGPVRAVRPELVFELHFEGIQISKRHKAGLAVRFPRMARWRRDKKVAEADTLETLRQLAQQSGASDAS